jgi:deoxyribodipyrimidine photo-lyase
VPSSSSSLEKINVIWLKRDFRLRSHEPLFLASAGDTPLLMLYIIEPILLEDPHYDLRHWRFILQSIVDINQQLIEYNTQILVIKAEACEAFSQLSQAFCFERIYSHQ